ncbi:hypothetical protein GCM10017608_20680 [Agromyces luteolus]|uniref:DUF4232 domain-containing protein n=1 Tax=Agromyces luteolus TaxID=88373 RepID=A0A7C9LEN1_9MICO|nr:hypothetical protein [Agromyces luteolus]MUN08772.1 hypothetical protein [Agromyces luteolus]GLK28134.1 hypothetical protein GCM10017608_20680 [Agromyces luteolus]
MPPAARSSVRLARGTAAGLAVGVLAAAALTACATGAGPDAERDAALPDGLTVAVQQGRLDVPQGRLVLHFENTGEPVTVTAVAVRSPALEPGMDRDEPFALGRGDAIDIRLDLTGSVCDGDPAAIGVDVRLTAADGAEREGTLEPDDPFGTMARIADADCLAESVAGVAAIELPERLRTTGTGADRRAWIDVRVAPVASGDGTLSIDGVSATTLIGNEEGQDWPLGIEVAAGDEPVDAALAVRPARCDAHALADDKRGTILPFTVATGDGREGRLEIASGAALKADLYAYYAERCGL